MSIEVQLQQLARSLRIEPPASTTAQPGEALLARLAPDPGKLEISDVVESTLSLTWVKKEVRFADAALEPSLLPADLGRRILGGMPILTGSLTPPAGVPGDLGQLVGTLSLPTDLRVPVAVEVRWDVTSTERRASPPAGATGADLFEPLGADSFLFLGGGTSDAVSVLLAPPTFELGAAPPADARRLLHARVTLTVGDVSETVDVGPLEIAVAPLGIPKLLALFRHRNFAPITDESHPWPSSPAWESWVLLVVPSSSPIAGVEALNALLTRLGGVVSTLHRFTSFATFAAGITELGAAISAQMFVQLIKSNGIADLGNVEFRGWDSDRGHLKPEDHASALILIGPSGAAVELNNDENQAPGNGRFHITTDLSMVAMVRNFASIPTAEGIDPSHPDGGILDVKRSPGGRREADLHSDITGFDNEISSLRFV